MLESEQFKHIKQVYSLVDCLGDLGGLIEIILVGGAFFVRPIAFHSFILNSIKKLYTVKTKKTNLFREPSNKLKGVDNLKKQIQISEFIGHQFRKDLINERIINIRLRDSIYLFICRLFPCFGFCWKSKKDFKKLFDEG